MKLNNLELIDTELGKIPVIVNTIYENGQITFEGKMVYSEMDINILTATKESCLVGLKNGFDLQMHFWLYRELPMEIIFHGE